MISCISKFRNQLMGIMILWVMLFHVQGIVFPGILQSVKIIGYGGVDGFLFLSGMGMFYSLFKDHDVIDFYKRRLKKLLPSYYPILFLWLGIIIYEKRPENIIGVIVGSITGQAFWHNAPIRFNWYIQAIWLFYCLAPFFVLLVNLKKQRYLWGTVLIFALMNTVFFDSFTLIAVSRFPVFILGIYAGKLLCEKKELSFREEILSYLAGILGLMVLARFIGKFPDYLWKFGLWWYPFIAIIPGLLGALSRILSWMEHSNFLKWFNILLGKFGSASFELYLVHVFLFETFQRKDIIVLSASVVIAFLYHALIQKIIGIRKFFKTSSPKNEF